MAKQGLEVSELGKSSPGVSRRRRRIALTCLAVYLLLLAPLASMNLGRIGIPSVNTALVAWLNESNILPGIRFGHVEAAANVAVFVPIGFLLALIVPRRLWLLAAAGGTILSACIETAQWLFLPGRQPSLRDVVTNSLGALIGALLALLVLALARHHSQSSRRALSPPLTREVTLSKLAGVTNAGQASVIPSGGLSWNA